MSNTVKIILYVVLFVCLVTFASLFWASYSSVTSAPPPKKSGPTNETAVVATDGAQRAPSKRVGRMMTYGTLAFISLLGMGLLVARDMAGFVGSRTESLILSGDGEGLRSPEYEQAETIWANGNFLEAVQLMRDYQKENPRELHVALRIAEIYEKDLANPLAAALEYEEVIKHKLPAERWGWAAIHLANLYSGKLNKPDQAVELLRRIIAEYGHTAAAKKARERLASEAPAVAVEIPDPDNTGSNLPPGFSPKK